jgi:hypothetical protein
MKEGPLNNISGQQSPSTKQVKQHLGDSSRALADLTVDMIYDNPGLLKNLVELSITGSDPYAQRASRVVSICCERFPELFKPYNSLIINKIREIHSKSVLRNFLKIYAEVPVGLTNKSKSVLLNQCFDFLTSPDYPVAVKAYSIQILYNLSREIPEIGLELYNLLDDQLPASSPGYASRAKKIMKKLAH